MINVESTLDFANVIPPVLSGDLYVVTTDGRFLMYGADKAFRKSETYGMILHGEDALRAYLAKVPESVNPEALQVYALNRRGRVSTEDIRRVCQEERKKEG